MPNQPIILITNDDGIHSPGLHAAIAACAPLGELLIAAPAIQQTAAGRSKSLTSTGSISVEEFVIDNQRFMGYAADGTPSQVVEYALFELIGERSISLAISGINYGENIGESITTSGTVGAAMEAASFGIPSIAASLQMPSEHYLSHDEAIDFTTATHFTRHFAKAVLQKGLPQGVDLLKLDIPQDATPQTATRWTRVSRRRYFFPAPKPRQALSDHAPMGFTTYVDATSHEVDSDVHAVMIDKVVSISPMTNDLTARVELSDMASCFSENESGVDS